MRPDGGFQEFYEAIARERGLPPGTVRTRLAAGGGVWSTEPTASSSEGNLK